jgi:hypothetical protein
VVSSAITIVIEDVLFVVFFTMTIKEIARYYPFCEKDIENSEKKEKGIIFII